jgi:hypothetical protein
MLGSVVAAMSKALTSAEIARDECLQDSSARDQCLRGETRLLSSKGYKKAGIGLLFSIPTPSPTLRDNKPHLPPQRIYLHLVPVPF